ncbi:MerR family transcriptional regulator [Staphylococcus sp. ACRSN]|uniref:MerR family transcriptional regulator n=1 Tax=Staphylococcus sp. ACRSN TaxID=2918214 RepID=UPI001EF38ED6|nr:MerR family transcriptional regulator [Staphylococcus sp. ACRSN]MCG7338847.1 MerR family transcriptional regulator [Staphylococcus sp. ACRSN]
MYTIKEASKILGLTEHTLRYYTDKGLTPSLIRDENNKRLFNDASLQWLAGAKKLKTCGMSIDNIKKYVDLCLEGESTINERYELIAAQKEEVLKKYEEIKKMKEYIINKEQHYRDIMEGKIEDDTNPSLWGNSDKKFDYIEV